MPTETKSNSGRISAFKAEVRDTNLHNGDERGGCGSERAHHDLEIEDKMPEKCISTLTVQIGEKPGDDTQDDHVHNGQHYLSPPKKKSATEKHGLLELKDTAGSFQALDVTEAAKHRDEELQKASAASTSDNLRLFAIIVSWISVVFSFTSGVAAIVISEYVNSETLFGYGLDAVLDSLSSVAVIWRFYGKGSSTAAEAKERKACIVIALFFFVSSASLIYKSIEALIDGARTDEEEDRVLTDAFSIVCGVLATILGILKVYLGLKLESRALITDSVITFVGAAMSFLGVVSVEVYIAEDQVWYLDAIFGGACGIFLLCFGIKLLTQMTCLYTKHEPLLEEAHAEFEESMH